MDEEDLGAIAQKIVAELVVKSKIEQVAQDVVEGQETVSDTLHNAMLRIADSVSPHTWALRSQETRGFGPFTERSDYKNGEVFLNTLSSNKNARQMFHGNSHIGAEFLICAAWTGDCHHEFIPVMISPETSALIPREPVSGYEYLGRPLYILKSNAILEILRHGLPLQL